MPGHIGSAIPSSTTAAVDRLPVLIIEDDPALLRSLVGLLRAHRLFVATARGSAQGLDLFRRLSPVVVLTDLMHDGIGSIMQMRRERPAVKIIAMVSALRIGRMDLSAIAQELGADATFKKPFGAWDLAATICRMLEQRSIGCAFASTPGERLMSTERGLYEAICGP